MRHRLASALVVFCSTAAQPVHAQSAAQTTLPSIESGAINGAPFRIEIPPNWNKGLVMYARGYRPAGAPPWNPEDLQSNQRRAVILSRGFAFAESGYSANGWAVKEGIEDTEALRRYFVAKYGKASETYITGGSMGGHITIATIERYPETYQGALPMCGPLGAAVDFLNNAVFDMLVTFEALFPDTIGSPYHFSAETSATVKAAIAAQPERAAR